jgi:hypothetical protein
VQAHDRHRPRRPAAQDSVSAVRKRRVDPAFNEAGVDSVENSVKAAAEQPRERSAAGGEAAVGGNEMAASMLLVHVS